MRLAPTSAQLQIEWVRKGHHDYVLEYQKVVGRNGAEPRSRSLGHLRVINPFACCCLSYRPRGA